MTQAAQGQIMPLNEGLILEDKNGDPIKWQKQDKDGTYTAEVDSPLYRYLYQLTPNPTMVNVTVIKQPLETAESKTEPAKKPEPKKQEPEPEPVKESNTKSKWVDTNKKSVGKYNKKSRYA